MQEEVIAPTADLGDWGLYAYLGLGGLLAAYMFANHFGGLAEMNAIASEPIVCALEKEGVNPVINNDGEVVVADAVRAIESLGRQRRDAEGRARSSDRRYIKESHARTRTEAKSRELEAKCKELEAKLHALDELRTADVAAASQEIATLRAQLPKPRRGKS